jgi:hypothetical protein
MLTGKDHVTRNASIGSTLIARRALILSRYLAASGADPAGRQDRHWHVRDDPESREMATDTNVEEIAKAVQRCPETESESA